MTVEQIETEDGSPTLRDVERDLTYRSVYGAQRESQHVFVEAVRRAEGRRARVIEFGFGGAMNFIETARWCIDAGVALDYVSVEAFPVSPEMLAHPDVPLLTLAQRALREPNIAIHDGGIAVTVVDAGWLDATLTGQLDGPFDAAFHDPFGPRDAPDCWTVDVFARYAELLKPTGLLTTYSAATRVRRALLDAGFSVASRPGPGRKREVTIAARQQAALDGYELWGSV